eukprot:1162076-Pelagomonas_calceolata.AAC.2
MHNSCTENVRMLMRKVPDKKQHPMPWAKWCMTQRWEGKVCVQLSDAHEPVLAILLPAAQQLPAPPPLPLASCVLPPKCAPAHI